MSSTVPPTAASSASCSFVKKITSASVHLELVHALDVLFMRKRRKRSHAPANLNVNALRANASADRAPTPTKTRIRLADAVKHVLAHLVNVPAPTVPLRPRRKNRKVAHVATRAAVLQVNAPAMTVLPALSR
ncbi:hypothetical protein V865_000911 [Kwoniella europaea PYCC6329]|uniref:Uncharacterized protein n=1 Tax=Kwoniella europaea PYCC6329 TaxID=1423913 RepID=A0AAX4KA81_9TREE